MRVLGTVPGPRGGNGAASRSPNVARGGATGSTASNDSPCPRRRIAFASALLSSRPFRSLSIPVMIGSGPLPSTVGSARRVLGVSPGPCGAGTGSGSTSPLTIVSQAGLSGAAALALPAQASSRGDRFLSASCVTFATVSALAVPAATSSIAFAAAVAVTRAFEARIAASALRASAVPMPGLGARPLATPVMRRPRRPIEFRNVSRTDCTVSFDTTPPVPASACSPQTSVTSIPLPIKASMFEPGAS